MAMQLKPLGARVVVEPNEQEEITAGGIVLNSPWVGIAFEWPEVAKRIGFLFWSIDTLWLYLALAYGIPGVVLIALSMVSAACYPMSGRGENLSTDESRLATGLSVSIAVIVLLGFTVHFWGASWMLVGLLVGVRAHLASLGSARPSKLTTAGLRSVQNQLGAALRNPNYVARTTRFRA